VLVASTGVIGVPLKAERITRKLPQPGAALEWDNASAVARAIMTTDTVPKSVVVRSELAGRPVHIAGIAKGAGMIHPRMATMLSFLTTDAAISPRMLQSMLAEAVEGSFNRVSVDGDTSTNDTVLLLASGASGAAVRPGNSTRRWFMEGLRLVTESLAKMIARDGEGATKLVTVEVRGARTPLDAERAGRAIANSPLVKTAIAGCDPNWGRILCAAGYSGARFDPARVDIRVNDLYLCRKGLDTGFDEASASREFDQKELTVAIHLHAGSARARFWTCDLTHDYITINASYRT
jgi:glutamate N-acetyltransferase/amino-acid N-acetyltransferase